MNIKVLSAILILNLFAGCNSLVSKSVFPDKEWAKKEPGKAGLNLEAFAQIDSLMKKAEANGVLIYKGYLIAEWNYDCDSTQRYEVQSITKSITSAVLLPISNPMQSSV